MDEITILASAASALLAAGVTRLLVKPESVVLTGETRTKHVHEAVSVDSSGWSCACGLHYHRYIKGRCIGCGEKGTVDRWPTTPS